MKATALLGAAALMVIASAATAAPTVSFAAGSGTMAPGMTVFENFDSYAPGTSMGSNAAIYDANIVNVAARPAFGSTGNFAGVTTGGSYTVNFAAANVFSFMLGSVDTYNSLTLMFSDNSTMTYLGGQIINDLSFPSGNQISGETNGVVSYYANGGPKMVGATFASTGNSFEIDNLAISGAGVPEPSTWAMMIIGFGAVAGVMRRRRAVPARA